MISRKVGILYTSSTTPGRKLTVLSRHTIVVLSRFLVAFFVLSRKFLDFSVGVSAYIRLVRSLPYTLHWRDIIDVTSYWSNWQNNDLYHQLINYKCLKFVLHQKPHSSWTIIHVWKGELNTWDCQKTVRIIFQSKNITDSQNCDVQYTYMQTLYKVLFDTSNTPVKGHEIPRVWSLCVSFDCKRTLKLFFQLSKLQGIELLVPYVMLFQILNNLEWCSKKRPYFQIKEKKVDILLSPMTKAHIPLENKKNPKR